MANENCLEGHACPKCGSEGPFTIECTTLATVDDDGVEENEGYEWDGTDYCACRECEYQGTVSAFWTELRRQG